MPQGKGTYGSIKGRPPKKQGANPKKKITIISKEKRQKLKMKLKNLFKRKFKNDGSVQPGIKPKTDIAIKKELEVPKKLKYMTSPMDRWLIQQGKEGNPMGGQPFRGMYEKRKEE